MNIIQKLLDHLEMIGDEDKVKKIVKVASAIIMRENEDGTKAILVIKRSSEDHWPLHFEFPRGKCDKGPNEKLIPCLKREVKEETGLDVKPIEFLGKFEYLADKGTRKSICYTYLCKMTNPDQKVVFKKTPGGIIEHEGYKWITQMGEAELLLHPDQMRFAEKVLSTNNPIISRPENDFTKNNQIEEQTDSNEYDEIIINLRDPDNQLVKLIDYIQRLSAPGHSFDVVVDPDMKENRESFFIDGDGPFFIKDVKMNKKKVVVKNDQIEEVLKRLK